LAATIGLAAHATGVANRHASMPIEIMAFASKFFILLSEHAK
jgi:hypothetical protein